MSTKWNYSPAQLNRDVKRLARAYPFITTGSIGRSVLGKPIPYLRLGAGPFRWHFNGACHANEWITSLILMRFVEEYAKASAKRAPFWGKSAKDLFTRCSLWIVPMLNPDGVELVQQGITPRHPLYKELMMWNRGSASFHRWKANARGVDLNDQFPANWEDERMRRKIKGPGPRDYGGTAPLCEPEAIAIAKFTEDIDFNGVIALHSQGEEIYWNYRNEEPPEAEAWAQRLAEASGYRAVYLEGSDAGFKDWFITKFKRPGFTVEAGWGHNPLPMKEFEWIYDDVARLLAEALDCSVP